MTLAFNAFKDSCPSLTEKRVELCKGFEFMRMQKGMRPLEGAQEGAPGGRGDRGQGVGPELAPPGGPRRDLISRP